MTRAAPLIRSLAIGLSTASVLALAGCSGSSKPGFDGTTYRSGPIAFQVGSVPSSWRRVDVTDASLAYRDDGHAASILVNARCHSPDDGTPLVALTNHLVMGSTMREIAAQEAEPFDGREALHTKMRAKWDGVPMALDIFVMKKDGCVYDFVYMGAPSGFDDGTKDFEGFVKGFRTLPGSGVVKGRA